MRFAPLLCSCLFLFVLSPLGATPPVLRFRQWISGQEVGGVEQRYREEGTTRVVETHEWLRVERAGMAVDQSVRHEYRRDEAGNLKIRWSLRLAQEPLEGDARWEVNRPRSLELRPTRGEVRKASLPEQIILWPLDQDAALKEAARKRQSLSIAGFSFPTQQPSELNLSPAGLDPLPGFPDTVRFQGSSREGGLSAKVVMWISPTAGEIKQESEVAGFSLLLQRAELPSPKAMGAAGFFEQTLRPLPAHPFLPWLRSATLRWTGAKELELPRTPQQLFQGRRLELARAPLPSAKEAAQAPVTGKPSTAEAAFLAATPLVDYRDPVFEGLLGRLQAPPGATRWELAQLITRFVFEWIEQKDFSVGFASAQEVARTAKGDCTEHGVLAVALLRRLGVPARGATGWVALGETLGLHFWVEVKLQDRWVPVDPTFDEAPASALHIQLGSSDLADLGSLGWEQAALDLTQGSWVPDLSWPAGFQVLGEAIAFPQGQLRAAGGRWRLQGQRLSLRMPGASADLDVEAVPRPPKSQLKGAQIIQDAQTGLRGWRLGRQFWIALPNGHWLRVQGASEAQAFQLLAALSLDFTP